MPLPDFFKYNGMNFEEFVGAWFRSEFLAAGVRKFESTNYLYEMIKEELNNGNAKSVRKKKPNKKQKRKIARTVQQSIPIDAIYKDGNFSDGTAVFKVVEILGHKLCRSFRR